MKVSFWRTKFGCQENWGKWEKFWIWMYKWKCRLINLRIYGVWQAKKVYLYWRNDFVSLIVTVIFTLVWWLFYFVIFILSLSLDFRGTRFGFVDSRVACEVRGKCCVLREGI